VQHRLQEHAKEVNELLLQKAYFYVCGDAANMAREVNTVLAKIIAEQRGIPEEKAEEIVKSMRSANQYQVRPRLFTFSPLTIFHGRCLNLHEPLLPGYRRKST
jgi:methyl coenzyme M reductase alpha subunit